MEPQSGWVGTFPASSCHHGLSAPPCWGSQGPAMVMGTSYNGHPQLRAAVPEPHCLCMKNFLIASDQYLPILETDNWPLSANFRSAWLDDALFWLTYSVLGATDKCVPLPLWQLLIPWKFGRCSSWYRIQHTAGTSLSSSVQQWWDLSVNHNSLCWQKGTEGPGDREWWSCGCNSASALPMLPPQLAARRNSHCTECFHRANVGVNFYVRILQHFIMILSSIKCWHTLEIGESSAI